MFCCEQLPKMLLKASEPKIDFIDPVSTSADSCNKQSYRKQGVDGELNYPGGQKQFQQQKQRGALRFSLLTRHPLKV